MFRKGQLSQGQNLRALRSWLGRCIVLAASACLGTGAGRTASAAEAASSIYISEFLAENAHGLKDDDGNYSPWIEIHQTGTVPVDLGGWFLTDNRAHLTKWRFPAVTLLPDKHMVIFASGKNRLTDLAHLHTNFRLNPAGGYLALVNRATNIVSEFAPAYPKQAPDVSFGSVVGEPTIRGRFLRPSPGRHNSSSGAEFAPAVNFSRASGNFTEPFNLQLSCGSNNAVIRYTLDGTLPTSVSKVYEGPLRVTNTMHLRARAYQDGLLPGPPHSEAYLKLFTNALNFSSTLPILILDTFGRELPVSAHTTFTHFSWQEPAHGRSWLTNPPALTTRAAFRVRGSTSAGMPQQGFALEFVDEFNQGRPLAIPGLPADSDWILYAPNAYDPVLIHNPFVHQLSRDLGRYSPRTRFVEVFLVHGAGRVRETYYNGVYVLEEKIKIGKNRVDIDRLGPEDLKPPQVTGGYLLKFDRLGPGEEGLSAGGAGLVYVEPKEQTIVIPQRNAQREYLSSFLNDFDRALHSARWKDPTAGYRAYLDVNAAIDFHVLEVLSGNVDALVLSTYFYKPRNGKIMFGPHWDFDRALGSTDGRDENPRMWSTGPFFGGAWWPRLFRDPDFWQQWVDRWQELRRTHFSLAHQYEVIDRMAGELREAQPREYQKWGFQPRGGSYRSEIQLMKNWLSNRVDFIDGQLVQPPTLSHQGGLVAPGLLLTLGSRQEASVYYTLDGSDPRLSQGGISSNAVRYAKPIPIVAKSRLIARAHNPGQRQTGGPPASTPWSGPINAAFDIQPQPGQ
ncbi:MAG TPA: CotH kinase family protein [Verrucomicrobiae bacterium]|nr:CotH kinase family protein [Verrucomicrobiae bacterium]